MSSGTDKKEKEFDHFILAVDDDPDFNILLKHILKDLGIRVRSYTDSGNFLKNLKVERPDLCLVDLNIESKGIGFIIIKAIRKVLGKDLPLLVVSGVSEPKSIAHALEMGANDYIVKPMDRELLASKLRHYLKSDRIFDSELKERRAPGEGIPANFLIDFKISEIEEFGIKLTSKHLLSKGTVVHINGPIIEEITGSERPLIATINSTWLAENGSSFRAFAEFDATNDTLLTQVRTWLLNNSEN